MSNLCKLIREALKDEKDAPILYTKLQGKMLGHKKNKDIIEKIIKDEKSHHDKIKEIGEELGCFCDE